ncbi:hypothetical protein [Nocardia wallacei]|uniref:hypothetical protein n=1 Tax=Nocardia wallacei TaxID=480035 RepID=UPI00245544F1|nr:hypothetical protein [Nocardia wallacei]
MAAYNRGEAVDSVIPESDVPGNRVAMGDQGGGSDQATSGSDDRQVGMPVHRDVDAVCDGLTVSFEVRYVGGAEGERIAAAQAKALAALLKWQADRSRDGCP